MESPGLAEAMLRMGFCSRSPEARPGMVRVAELNHWLRIPLSRITADRYRRHYVKAKVRVHRYPNGSLAFFLGPRRLASYASGGVVF